LDSNIIIPYLADDLATVPLVERLALEGITISIITYLEAYQGILRSPDPAAAQERFDRMLAVVPVLPLSLAVARRCAELREALRQQGRRVRARAFDLVIATTALEHGYTLVTHNRKDYDDILELALYQETL
jgi:predicted nucleic acid-binding protein